ncbi:hypothetical protein CEXT_375311 [Caerostris extrusa]|uniref:Uncharacterized protein n=1 Tax=Caerostris extrusa TaxID=172846 RepID=A0AAV4XIY1_CAEEX|nr:hypothetical protein CEXT_375311 [Caerostris extrusa]
MGLRFVRAKKVFHPARRFDIELSLSRGSSEVEITDSECEARQFVFETPQARFRPFRDNNTSGSRWAKGAAFCSRPKRFFPTLHGASILNRVWDGGKLRKSKSLTASVRLGNLSLRILKHIFDRFRTTGINKMVIWQNPDTIFLF